MLLTTMMKNNWKDYWIGLVCTVQGTEGANEFLSKIFSFLTWPTMKSVKEIKQLAFTHTLQSFCILAQMSETVQSNIK